MTYILAGAPSPVVTTLGAAPPAPDMIEAGILTAVAVPLEGVMKTAIKAALANPMRPNPDNYTIWNTIRFGPDGPGLSKAQRTARENKADYIPPFKQFRDALATALRPVNKSKRLGGLLRWQVYQWTDAARQELLASGIITKKEEDSKGGGGSAEAASYNTWLLYGGLGVAVLAAGYILLRKPKAPASAG